MLPLIIIHFFCLFNRIRGHDLKGFDDTILFDIDWRDDFFFNKPIEEDPLEVTTHNKHKYTCLIPKLEAQEVPSALEYTGPGPLDLISILFTSPACSYRIESYWTYEVCHGNYIKQYHEEREGKQSKLQEYFLGKWNTKKTDGLRQKLEASEKNNEKLKYKKIDGLSLPYLELEMSDGTICDLNNQPRLTKVLYVCYAHGKNEIYSLKEVSTCQYEVIILTPTLCSHPNFKPQDTAENTIRCSPFGSAPVKPKAMWSQSFEGHLQKIEELTSQLRNMYIFKYDEKDSSFKLEKLKNDNFGILTSLKDNDNLIPSGTAPPVASLPAASMSKKPKDTSPATLFLQGKNCLTGGFGWWKYEFCYGRYVRQFHIDRNGVETSVMLGFFDEELHKKWIDEHEEKKPKPVGLRAHLSHFYQGGTLCELTGKRRQTEVKLKCMDSKSGSSTSVSLYLMEPQTCQYVLGVESPLICDLLKKADEYGLMNMASGVNKESSDSEDGVFLGNAVVEDVEGRFEND